MQKWFKKAVPFVMAAVIVFGSVAFIPVTAHAATGMLYMRDGASLDEYDLADPQGNLVNLGWEWDNIADTLTLDGFTVDNISFDSPGLITVNIKGDSTITSPDTSPALSCTGSMEITSDTDSTLTVSSDYDAIISEGDLIISGDVGVISTSTASSGIYSSGDISITTTGEVTATGESNGLYTDNGDITISGGTVICTGKDFGLLAFDADGADYGNITISGGTVTAEASNHAAIDALISINISGDADVTAKGIVDAHGIQAGNYIHISDGCTVTVNSVKDAISGIYAVLIEGSQTKVSAVSTSLTAIYSHLIAIADGTVNATGPNTGYALTANEGGWINIYDGIVTLSNGNAGHPINGYTYLLGGTTTLNGELAPTVTGISPDHGSAAGGTNVIISGEKLSDAFDVYISAPIEHLIAADGQITGTTNYSPFTSGTEHVLVEFPNNMFFVLPNGFTYELFTDVVSGLRFTVLSESGNTGTAMVIGGDYTNSSYTIPATVVYDSGNGNVTYTVTKIGDSAFGNCSNIENIIISNGIQEIGTFAFAGCSSLKTVSIPASVTSIGDWAFDYCYNLLSITVDPGNQDFSSVDGALFNKTKTVLWRYPSGKPQKSYTVPDGVTVIYPDAFCYAQNLTGITLPVGVKEINEFAFEYCLNLTNITIPAGVTEIGSAAFAFCVSLANVTIPASVTRIDAFAFEHCLNLTNITIPAGVTEIGSTAFAFCVSLANVTIPASVTRIDAFAFAECESLKNFTFLGSTPPAIGPDVFYEIPQAMTVTVPAGTLSKYKTALNGLLPEGSSIKEATVIDPVKPSSGGGGGGSSSVPVAAVQTMNINGTDFDISKIDTAKPSYIIEILEKDIKDGTAFVSIPSSVFTTLSGKNAFFIIEIRTPFGIYQAPVNLQSLIPGLSDSLGKNNLKEADVSFKITLTDMSEDVNLKTEFAKNFPDGKIIGSFVDFKLEVINTKTGNSIAQATNFNKSITRFIPLLVSADKMPKQYGTFRYTNGKFEFVPHKYRLIDGEANISVASMTNSVYVVVENAVKFDDVKEGAWFTESIEKAAAKGLVNGVGDNLYDPDRSVTRAEFVQMIANAMQLPTVKSGTKAYLDLIPDSWYFGAVMKAKSAGLLDKFTGDNFKPDQAITREEMAVILAAVLTQNNVATTMEMIYLDQIFTDHGSMNEEYLPDIELVYRTKLMQGVGDGKFDPEAVTTRAQAATVQINLLKKLGMID